MTSNNLQRTAAAGLFWFLGSLFYLFQFILRASPNAMANHLIQEFGINACALGVFSATYYYAYCGLQIPLGIALDHLKPQYLLSAGTAICTGGLFLFATSPTLSMALAGRFLIGAGAACGLLSAMNAARRYLPLNQQPLAIAITIAMGNLGGMMGNSWLTGQLQTASWRSISLTLTLCGAALTFFTWLCTAFFLPRESNTIAHQKENILHSLSWLISQKDVWKIAVYAGLACLPLTLLADTWGQNFLYFRHNISHQQASHLIAYIFLGLALGAPSIAAVSRLIASRKHLLSFLSGTNAAICLVLIYLPLSPPLLGLLLFSCGFCIGVQALVFPHVMACVPPEKSGLSVGFVNMFIMMGGGLFHPIVGGILDILNTNGHTTCPTIISYQVALTLLPIALFTATIISISIPETAEKESRTA